MRNLLFCILTIVVLAGQALASDVVVLQSSRLLPLEQARQGLEKVLLDQPLTRGIKHIHSGDLRLFVLSEEPDRESLGTRIRKEKPAVVVAIGASALGLALTLQPIPVVYLMTPEPGALTASHPAAVGVSMVIPPSRQLQQFAKVLPTLKRIGIIHQQGQSGGLIAEARTGAAASGIELIAQPAAHIGEVPALLSALRGRIDALWLLPDSLLTSPRVLEEALLFSFRNKIPILSFTSRHLEAGAAAAIRCEPEGMGEKAGELAREILRGDNSRRPAPVLPEIILDINRTILKKMGIPFTGSSGGPGGPL